MLTPFSKYQNICDIIPLLNDKESIILPLCDNTVFVMKKTLDPFENDFITFDANQATVVGLYTKLYKLTSSITSAYKEDRLDLICIYARLMIEAYIKMKYLIQNGEGAQKLYRLSSFKGRLDMYKEHIQNPNPTSAIMVEKFLATIAKEGFTIEEIEAAPTKAFGGKNFRQLMEDTGIGDLYTTQYRIGSDSIHSDWGEIQQMFMYINNGRYAPKLDVEPLHFRVVIQRLSLALTATEDYIDWMKDIDCTMLIALKGLAHEFQRVLTLIKRYIISIYENSPDVFMEQ